MTFSKPDAVLFCRFAQPCFSLTHKIDGPSFPYYCAIFDDALKILVAREKMTN